MEKKHFKDFLMKFPVVYDEHKVIHAIGHALKCAEKHQEQGDQEYLKYLSKAYYMLEAYFTEKGVHPEQFK